MLEGHTSSASVQTVASSMHKQEQCKYRIVCIPSEESTLAEHREVFGRGLPLPTDRAACPRASGRRQQIAREPGEPSQGPYVVVGQSTPNSVRLKDPATDQMVDGGVDIPLEQILAGPR